MFFNSQKHFSYAIDYLINSNYLFIEGWEIILFKIIEWKLIKSLKIDQVVENL